MGLTLLNENRYLNSEEDFVKKETGYEITKDPVFSGVYLTGYNKNIFQNNYNKLWKGINDLERWKNVYRSSKENLIDHTEGGKFTI